MYKIYFYEDKNGNSEIYKYIKALSRRTDKDSRVNAAKLNDYIQVLSKYGKAAGEPYIKHLKGEIWELRPIKNRVLFASWTGSGFILLHYFTKKTRKTPAREIQQAEHNLKDISERGGQV